MGTRACAPGREDSPWVYKYIQLMCAIYTYICVYFLYMVYGYMIALTDIILTLHHRLDIPHKNTSPRTKADRNNALENTLSARLHCLYRESLRYQSLKAVCHTDQTGRHMWYGQSTRQGGVAFASLRRHGPDASTLSACVEPSGPHSIPVILRGTCESWVVFLPLASGSSGSLASLLSLF
jgi:hypothetical protein